MQIIIIKNYAVKYRILLPKKLLVICGTGLFFCVCILSISLTTRSEKYLILQSCLAVIHRMT